VKTPAHMALGAAVAAAPDVALLAFGWRRRWLPDGHPLVRAHRFLHSPAAVPLIAAAAWASHLVADRYSTHRTEATRRGRIR
jgi:hypothetical protein